MVGAHGEVLGVRSPLAEAGLCCGEVGRNPPWQGRWWERIFGDSIQGRRGESCITEQNCPLPVGPGTCGKGLQVDRAWDLPRGTPQPHVHSLLGKGGESRGRAQRCLSCSSLVTRASAVPRAAGPGAVGPRAVGLLLLHLPRLQHALLCGRREVGESCGMGDTLCPVLPSTLRVPPPPHARSSPMRRGQVGATLAPRLFWFCGEELGPVP